MKKIMMIDGGPRKRMNTAQMIEQFAAGVKSVQPDIEVKHVRLYDYEYHGCYSCMLCKQKDGKYREHCGYKDGITDVLKETAYADALVLASPIYYMDLTAQTHAFIERLCFPWLNYKDYTQSYAPKKGRPTAIIYTMNMGEEHQPMFEQLYQRNETMLTMAAYDKPEHIKALSTKQVKDYSKFDFTDEHAQTHDQWHAEHFPAELQEAFMAGVRMANRLAQSAD